MNNLPSYRGIECNAKWNKFTEQQNLIENFKKTDSMLFKQILKIVYYSHVFLESMHGTLIQWREKEEESSELNAVMWTGHKCDSFVICCVSGGPLLTLSPHQDMYPQTAITVYELFSS